MATATEQLAAELAVEPGDVRAVLAQLDVTELTDEIAAEVRLTLNPHAERTEPGFYGATGMEV